VLTIANLSEMVINAHINQADVTRLKIGQQVEVASEAVAGLKSRHCRTDRPTGHHQKQHQRLAARILLKDVDRASGPHDGERPDTCRLRRQRHAVPLAERVHRNGTRHGPTERLRLHKERHGFDRRPLQIGVSVSSSSEFRRPVLWRKSWRRMPETKRPANQESAVMLPGGSKQRRGGADGRGKGAPGPTDLPVRSGRRWRPP